MSGNAATASHARATSNAVARTRADARFDLAAKYERADRLLGPSAAWRRLIADPTDENRAAFVAAVDRASQP